MNSWTVRKHWKSARFAPALLIYDNAIDLDGVRWAAVMPNIGLSSARWSLLAASLALGCDSGPPQSVEPGADTKAARNALRRVEKVGLTFAWPRNASATVTERILKAGRWSTSTYRIESRRTGQGWLIAHADHRVVEIQGLNLQTPQARQAVDLVEKNLDAATPIYRISPEGTWVGIEDTGEIADVFRGIYPPERIESIRSFVQRPGVRVWLDGALAKKWDAWVGHWIGLDLRVGEKRSIDATDDPAVESVVVERLADGAGRLKIRAEWLLKGNAALEQFVRSTMAPGDPNLEASIDAVRGTDITVHSVVEAELDPTTMLPLAARSHDSVEGPWTAVFKTEWSFEWD